MKKHLSLFLILCLLAACICGCAANNEETTITTEQTTTAEPAPDQTTEEPTYTETSTEIDISEPDDEPCLLTYSAVTTYQDSVGNTWLNVMVGYTNFSDAPVLLDYCDISVDADGEAILTLTDVAAYPSVIAPGETGYYFEQTHVELEGSEVLGLIFEPSIETTTEKEYFSVSEVQVVDAAFGMEVSGVIDIPSPVSGLIEVCAILYDANGLPITVLFDYLEGSETNFILSGDRLPEGTTAADISDCVVYACLYEN